MPNGVWRVVVGTVCLLEGAGCGSDAEVPAPVVPLCDGSANLTLRIFYSGGGQEVPGSEVRRENDGEMSATLFMRDALPYEDDRGLLPLPGE